MANSYLLTSSFLLLLIILTNSVGRNVDAGFHTCKEKMGQCCAPNDCRDRCAAKHPCGKGSCKSTNDNNGSNKVCLCSYPCPTPPKPPKPPKPPSPPKPPKPPSPPITPLPPFPPAPPGKCIEGLGFCGSNCKEICGVKHPGGKGGCMMIAGPPICMCKYMCGSDRQCNVGLGPCVPGECNDSCCNDRCLAKYGDAAGRCSEPLGPFNLCGCMYDCA